MLSAFCTLRRRLINRQFVRLCSAKFEGLRSSSPPPQLLSSFSMQSAILFYQFRPSFRLSNASTVPKRWHVSSNVFYFLLGTSLWFSHTTYSCEIFTRRGLSPEKFAILGLKALNNGNARERTSLSRHRNPIKAVGLQLIEH